MTLTNEQAAKMAQTIEGNAPLRSYLEQFDVDVPALCATVRHLREMMADPIFGFQGLQTRLTRMQEERDALRQEVEGLLYQRMFTDSHVGDD